MHAEARQWPSIPCLLVIFRRSLPSFVRAPDRSFVRVNPPWIWRSRSIAKSSKTWTRSSFATKGRSRTGFMAATRKVLDRAKFHGRDRRDLSREENIPSFGLEADTARSCFAALGTPSQDAIAREELARIEAAVHSLPEDQRDAVMMSRLMNLDYAQIAEQMGRTESAVRGLVTRGLAALADDLAG